MDGDALDLRNIADLLRRRAGLILLVTLLALGAASLALVMLKPVYSATALILVDPSKKNLLDPNEQAAGSSSDSLRVDSEVELVKSETTLLAVAKELGLAADPEFGLRLGPQDMLLSILRLGEPNLPGGREASSAVLRNLRDSVVVQRRGFTFLIAVSAGSQRPEFASAIANAVSRTYIEQQLQAKIASTLASASIIRDRVAEAGSTVAQSERAFDTFVEQNIARIGEATGRSDFLQLRDEISTLDALRAQSASALERTNGSLARRDWSAVAASLGNETVANLERQRVALLGGVADAAEGGDAIDLRGKLAAIEAELTDAAARAVAGLKQDVASAQGRVSDLRAQLRSTILQTDLPSEILTGIYGLQQTAEIARAQYQALLTRQNDLDTQAYLQVADSRLAAEATPPDTPAFPNPRLILLLAGLAGIGLGVALAFLIENFVGGFTSAAQAESILKAPVVSAVPRHRPIRRDGEAAPVVADSLVLAPLSAYSESIRRVRIGIDQAVRKRPQRAPSEANAGTVIVVTSAASGEGKTTVALSLARAYALAGMSTLLIDCDLRKPGVHKLLGLEASEGLLEYLSRSTDASDLRSILTVDQSSGARIIVGSHRSDIATDQLVAGKTFARLIEAARTNFDIVLLDTPPVGPVVDGLYLAGITDAIAFVVKFSSTPQQEVRAATASLIGAKADDVPILTILNQQTSNSATYRSKNAGYYAEA
jgi:succinoglycan biosynthesis transport protein ExoP